MSLESDIAVLRKVRLFDELETEQLRLLAFGAEHRRLRAGEFVYREAARADAGFVIADGSVVLTRGRPEREKLIGVFGPGDLLGELALLTETVRPASAKADTDCDLIRIGRPLFRRMLEEFPAFAQSLQGRLREDLAEMTRRLGEMEPRFRG
ncbi:MAG TPA: cyclic nucleotide-binding domain-containing protein [Aurantimonas sp.]|jgi:CRP-like cAMP-binding protein|nr:cyclic nucleotide-binding domain-containing protein [Aurantimonas sp.]